MFAGSGGGGGPGEGGWESYFQAVFKRVDMKMLNEDKVIYQGGWRKKKSLSSYFTGVHLKSHDRTSH